MADTPFRLRAPYEPAGDQIPAIKELLNGCNDQQRNQILLGVTGSGKTFTMAHIIEKTQRPALVLAHNKTLAAQLYTEFKNFFPENAVEYFVSYYDYYQPEAYVPRTDTYIQKDSAINEQIDRMRHSATRALLERRDALIVASVSCIYGIGSVETYATMTLELTCGMRISQRRIIKELSKLQYTRHDLHLERGQFRVRGDILCVFPSHLENAAWQVSLFGDEIESITEIHPLTGEVMAELDRVRIYANSHYVTPGPTLAQALKGIRGELAQTLEMMQSDKMLVEAQRLEQRTCFDLETLQATGVCKGIENYSRWLSGRPPGAPPPTLFEYLPDDALLFVDESHQTLPQLRGMYNGDMARKKTLARFGFRLPSCLDNRPMRFAEWDEIRPQTIFVSATPGDWEINAAQGQVVEQVIRPTGLLDPPVEIRPASGAKRNQIDDVIHAARAVVAEGGRVLITTLTKKMAEELTLYLHEQGLKPRYMHSDIDTVERIEIIRELRLGSFDILVGINLLREGLDIPECRLVAVLDADKEGFLRSETSLIQTIGRAARNKDSYVILYADTRTASIERAVAETERRRHKQHAYNSERGISPVSVEAPIAASLYDTPQGGDAKKRQRSLSPGQNTQARIADLQKRMRAAAKNLEFEDAASLRDEIHYLQKSLLIENG